MRAVAEEVRHEFIQLWAQLARVWRISAATAKVYAWLFSRPHGAEVDDLMTGLKVGRGTVSMACRELKEWGLIASQQEAGSRRTRHHVETDLAKVIRNIVLHRKSREWDPILEHAREWVARLESDRSPEAALFRERLRALAGCLALADAAVLRFLGGGTAGDIDLQALSQPARNRPPSGAGS